MVQASAVPLLRLVPAPVASPKSSPLRAVATEAALAGDVAKLVATVEGTVRKVAHHYSKGLSKEDLEDLRSAGRMGAIVAARRYLANHESTASFNTYATYWIRSYIAEEVAKFFWGRGRLKASSAVMKMFFRYSKVRRRIESRGGDATPEAMAAELGISIDTFESVAAAVAFEASLDAPAHADDGEEGASRLEEATDAEGINSLHDALCSRIDASRLHEAMDKLEERERFVLVGRFLKGRKLREVAEDLGLTRERVRQIEVDALVRLRSILTKPAFR